MSTQKVAPQALPTSGRSWAEISAQMQRARSNDAKWQEGKTFGGVYPGSAEITHVAQQAYIMFFMENLAHSRGFPSLMRFEREIVAMTASLLHAPQAIGSVTSGGTESLFLAVRTARDQARKERGVTSPQLLVPRTAYPAFDKIAHYLGVQIVRTHIDADFKADLAAVQDAITDNTVLIAASAPGFAHGVVDPIAQMAALASARGINFHVDASVGGYQLPFLRALGHPVPDFDLSVPGVTSMHADLHKFGYSVPGTSVILYRDAALREYQAFTVDWAIGSWRRPAMLGTRPGGALAASWAVMQFLGESGYLRLTESLWNTTQQMMQGINDIPGLQVWGKPEMSVFAYGSLTLDMLAIADFMETKGWYILRQLEPPGIHVVLTPPHERIVNSYLADLRNAVPHVRGAVDGSSGDKRTG